MKRILHFAAVCAILATASCAKEPSSVQNPATENNGKLCTLHIEDNEWLPEDAARSSFDPSLGIQVSGSEGISLFYQNGSKIGCRAVGSGYNYSYKASPAGGGDYTFTNPIAPEDGLWYAFVPYSLNCMRGTPSGENAATAIQYRVGPVQFPGANTFDPMSDILVGRPFHTVDGSGTVTAFKRMTAPLRINVTGLDAAERIYAVTLQFSGTATGSTSSLVGMLNITPAETFADTRITGIGTASLGRGISAIYGNGLSKVSDSWPVWFMVNPITLAAGTMTLSVTTADATYTRTVDVPSMTLVSDQINSLSFNIKGSGYTSAETVFQDLTQHSLGSSSTSLSAADGSSAIWTVSGTSRWTPDAGDDGSGHPEALNMQKNSVLTIPSYPGKKITNVKLFLHPCSSISSNLSTITVKDGGTALSTISNAALINKTAAPAIPGGYGNAGIINIALPDGRDDMSGLTLNVATNNVVTSAVLFETVDTGIDPNDLYAKYMSGEDLTIGGTIYNISSVTPILLKLYDHTQSSFNTAVADYPLVFLDYDEADGEVDKLVPTSNFSLGGKAIVGRYVNHQPLIDLVTNGKVIRPTGDLAFKNISFNMTSTAVRSESLTANASIAFEDCTLTQTTNNPIITDNHATCDFTNLYVRNCVIASAATSYGLFSIKTTGKTATNTSHTNYVVENNVIYCTAAEKSTGGQLVFYVKASDNSTYLTQTSLKIRLMNNTLYNFSGNVIDVKSPAQINMEYNAIETECGTESNTVLLSLRAEGSLNSSTSTSRYNWGRNTEASGVRGLSDMNSAWTSYFTRAANNWKKLKSGDPTIFGTSMNSTIGYFPIDQTVVTNGAGATYDTKLWRSWP